MTGINFLIQKLAEFVVCSFTCTSCRSSVHSHDHVRAIAFDRDFVGPLHMTPQTVQYNALPMQTDKLRLVYRDGSRFFHMPS